MKKLLLIVGAFVPGGNPAPDFAIAAREGDPIEVACSKMTSTPSPIRQDRKALYYGTVPPCIHPLSLSPQSL
jgi:hypothetical protein